MVAHRTTSSADVRSGTGVLIGFYKKSSNIKGLRAATQRYFHQKADFSFRKTGVPHLERRFFMPVCPARALSFSITSYHIYKRTEVTI